MKMNKKKIGIGQIVLNTFFILLSLCYILPLILLVSVSFDGSASQYFSLIPQEFSVAAYKTIFQNPQKILDAYIVTIFYSVTGVLFSLVVMSLFAYALSKPYFKLKKSLTFLWDTAATCI